MKKTILKTVGTLAVACIGLLGYVATQQPKIWCDHQWAGVCLLKGGYRSWTMRFCDGDASIAGKMQPVVITPTGYRKGYFRWPQFNHVDVRKLGITE
jgi:hypothetical protein